MAGEYELLLKPRLASVGGNGSALMADIQALSNKYPIKLDVIIDQSKIEAVKKQLMDLQAIASKTGGMGSVGVPVNSAGLQNAQKQLDTERNIAVAVKQQSASYNSVAAAQQQSTQQSVQQEASVKKVNQQAEILQSRIDRAKVSWSKMLTDPEVMSQVKQIEANLKNVGGDPQKMQEVSRQWQLMANNIAISGNNMKSFGDRVQETFSRLSSYLVNVLLIGTVTKALRDAFGDLKDIDSKLTEISKVTDLTRAGFKQASIDALESASIWGRTATDYLEATKTFAQAGASNYEELAGVSLMAQSAGDMTADLASKYLVATNAAFQLGNDAGKLTEILDGQNQISNRNAINMTEMATATQNYANTASIAGESAQTMSALITAGVASTTKPGEEVGRALRTLSMNIRSIKGKFCPCVQKCA